jgi:membrane fusion protein, copper/silver efflux system
VSLPDQRKTFAARVSEVLPQFDASTRSLKVRLEVENPGYTLRPDMFADVEFRVYFGPAIMVPADALIDSGARKTVFVDQGNGYFEPRQVETGWRFGDRVQIIKGLDPGERIVTSGNFLLDSESRMKPIVAGTKDPVCGMEIDPATARYKGEYGGKRHYFCSRKCQQNFEQGAQRKAINGKQDPGRRAQS